MSAIFRVKGISFSYKGTTSVPQGRAIGVPEILRASDRGPKKNWFSVER
jgi:hypothetical protein